MIHDYLKGLLGLALRSSWKAANGLEGAALAGAAMIWRGTWPIFGEHNPWEQAANWFLSFTLYAVIAWACLFFCRLAVTAPFQLWKRDRRVTASGLELIYDPADATCVRPITSLYGPTGEFFSVRIRNSGATTLSDVSIRALDSWFTQTIIATAQGGHSAKGHDPISLFQTDALHPDAPESVQLFGLSYHSDASHPEYILNTVQRFTLEAIARDLPAVRRQFEYDPNARPMLRILP